MRKPQKQNIDGNKLLLRFRQIHQDTIRLAEIFKVHESQIYNAMAKAREAERHV